jgi:hypothetical protein
MGTDSSPRWSIVIYLFTYASEPNSPLSFPGYLPLCCTWYSTFLLQKSQKKDFPCSEQMGSPPIKPDSNEEFSQIPVAYRNKYAPTNVPEYTSQCDSSTSCSGSLGVASK